MIGVRGEMRGGKRWGEERDGGRKEMGGGKRWGEERDGGRKEMGEAELSLRGVECCDVILHATEKQCELACRHPWFLHPTDLVAKTAAIIVVRLLLC
jgi:hypothetical protein